MTFLYLSGCLVPGVAHPMLGAMLTPDTGYRVPPDTWWAMDNACFNHADDFDFDRFERYIRRCMEQAGDRLLFVVTPDVPFDADETIRRFGEHQARMKTLGAPIGFVTQNGMRVEDLPWNDFDAMFVGGDTRWKTDSESGTLITEAKRRGKWVHMGRVNSYRKICTAVSMGCDSADGTFLARAPKENWQRMQSWFDKFERQGVMQLPTDVPG